MVKIVGIAVLVVVAAVTRVAAFGDEPAFPGSRLVTPSQGALLNKWSKQSAATVWAPCYTSRTMDKTPTEFHMLCDRYQPTVTVAYNAGGRPGRCVGKWEYQDGTKGDGTCSPIGSKCQDPAGGPPGPQCPSGGSGVGICTAECNMYKGGCDAPVIGSPCGPTNPGNFTFGGYADATWSGDQELKGTPASFIFGLGPGEPEHFGQPGQWAGPAFFPAWGGATSIPGLPNADGLWVGGTSMFDPTGEHGTGPPGFDGFCDPSSLCGGGGNWGETELEVWRPLCAADAHCGAHQTCDPKDGSCVCAVGWSGVGCGTCDKRRFCSGRGSCVLPSPSNTPVCHCDAGYSAANCSTFAGSALFPETKIVSPEWGTALDGWMSGIPDRQIWTLCYSSDTMERTTAEFHKRCDPYNTTLTVAKNSLGPGSSGTLGRPDNLKGVTFGGFVRPCPAPVLVFARRALVFVFVRRALVCAPPCPCVPPVPVALACRSCRRLTSRGEAVATDLPLAWLQTRLSRGADPPLAWRFPACCMHLAAS